jgi:hypothetical protein
MSYRSVLNNGGIMQKSGSNITIIMPIAFLLVLLIVPFTMNYLSHLMTVARESAIPLVMKLPVVDSSAFTVPKKVRQYEGFEVSMHLATKKLADLINKIGEMTTEGTGVQGITGKVSPEMQAEIIGDGLIVENRGPQEQLYVMDDETHWTWNVFPESSGNHKIKFRLHLHVYEDGKDTPTIVDVADANVNVQGNLSGWVARNWGWMALLFILPIVVWQVKRRYSSISSSGE